MVSLKTRCPTAICLHAGYTHTPSQTRHPSGDLISYSYTNTRCKCAQICLWFQDSFAHTFKHTHICLQFFFFFFLSKGTRAQGRQCRDILSFWMTPPLTSYATLSPSRLLADRKKDSIAKTHSAIWHSTVTTRVNLCGWVLVCENEQLLICIRQLSPPNTCLFLSNLSWCVTPCLH